MKKIKWLNEIEDAFKAFDGIASLRDIYDYVMTRNFSEYDSDDTWRSMLRKTIYQHSSDCDIYRGGADLFISEDGKGNGIWRMRLKYKLDTVEDFLKLPIGALVDAQQISNISHINRVKGIHPLNFEGASAVILCTIGGKNYPNDWIQKSNTLKYYLEGREVNGIKKYNPDIKSNSAVRNATNYSPLFVFVRNSKGEQFTYFGKFVTSDIVKEIDGGMYFILQRLDTVMHIGEIIIAEDNEEFPEGRIRERLHKSRERNTRLIATAKKVFKEKYGKLFCEICGFNFEKTYGKELGADYIEAHHKIPISDLKEGDVTKATDLVMVCANCHRILHRSRPWKTPEQLKEIMSS